jgi:hypothetical protein
MVSAVDTKFKPKPPKISFDTTKGFQRAHQSRPQRPAQRRPPAPPAE